MVILSLGSAPTSLAGLSFLVIGQGTGVNHTNYLRPPIAVCHQVCDRQRIRVHVPVIGIDIHYLQPPASLRLAAYKPFTLANVPRERRPGMFHHIASFRGRDAVLGDMSDVPPVPRVNTHVL
jgi:hypothetical protein